ncbi:MAG: hypothetical protein CL912_14795 [Deltaproteobacteria bacterium]|nr:hypothetical protein [Deltaproteobacteria bacterium]
MEIAYVEIPISNCLFQSSLLSKEPQSITAEDHELAASVMVFMVENQDHFLIGLTGTTTGDGANDVTDSNEQAMSDRIPEGVSEPNSLPRRNSA